MTADLQSQWMNIASLTLAVVSIVLAYVFYLRSLRAKEPCWTLRNLVLFEGFQSNLTDLQIQFRGSPVLSLSVARVLLWNRGRETINRSDLLDANPIRISAAPNVKILDAQLVAANNSASDVQVALAPAGNAVRVSFDYLDRGHGAVIQVVHTGTESQALHLEGVVKGASRIIRQDVEDAQFLPLPTSARFDRKLSARTRRTITAGVYMGQCIFLLVMAGVVMYLPPRRSADWFVATPIALIGLAPIIKIVRLAKNGPPAGLDAFGDHPLRVRPTIATPPNTPLQPTAPDAGERRG